MATVEIRLPGRFEVMVDRDPVSATAKAPVAVVHASRWQRAMGY
jgi:hypothetical protein